MADDASSEDEYELLPHKEIEDLKDELAKLKEFEIAPSKKLQVSLLELNTKLDKLLTIFEDATHEMRVEEGGLSFTEKMKPLLEKMSKILEQNSEIASGILALADMVKEVKESREAPAVVREQPTFTMPEMQMQPPMAAPAPRTPPMMARPMPPMPPMQGMPLPPPRRRTFGL